MTLGVKVLENSSGSPDWRCRNISECSWWDIFIRANGNLLYCYKLERKKCKFCFLLNVALSVRSLLALRCLLSEHLTAADVCSLCQHVCVDCKKNYCSGCSAELESRPLLCHTCQRFYGHLRDRVELMKLKVRELRDYLHLHGISTHLCREKVLFSSGDVLSHPKTWFSASLLFLWRRNW